MVAETAAKEELMSSKKKMRIVVTNTFPKAEIRSIVGCEDYTLAEITLTFCANPSEAASFLRLDGRRSATVRLAVDSLDPGA